MHKIVKHLGLDSHKNSIVIASADSGCKDEASYVGTIDNDMKQLDKIIRKYISQGFDVECVYEAGPCGYHIYRHLTGNGIKCSVIAPSRIPRQSGDRVKTDRRDAQTLARLHRAGELTPVYVPTPEDEALRDLVRAREDNKQFLRRAKQQLGAFLLRQNFIYPGRTLWSKTHFKWLADIAMVHPAQQIVLQEYIDTICNCRERVNRITKQMRELSKQSPLKALIDALASMRGISSLIATIVAVELGDLSRFDHPGQLMAYVGLIPSEHSSGPRVRRGAITKTGNGHVRKALVEAAQAYRLPARKSNVILKRQVGVPEKIQEISWKAQCRLCGRYRRLTARGKNANVAKTAIARELAGFAWAVSQELPEAA